MAEGFEAVGHPPGGVQLVQHLGGEEVELYRGGRSIVRTWLG